MWLLAVPFSLSECMQRRAESVVPVLFLHRHYQQIIPENRWEMVELQGLHSSGWKTTVPVEPEEKPQTLRPDIEMGNFSTMLREYLDLKKIKEVISNLLSPVLQEVMGLHNCLVIEDLIKKYGTVCVWEVLQGCNQQREVRPTH